MTANALRASRPLVGSSRKTTDGFATSSTPVIGLLQTIYAPLLGKFCVITVAEEIAIPALDTTTEEATFTWTMRVKS
jgi:hypothetical protein